MFFNACIFALLLKFSNAEWDDIARSRMPSLYELDDYGKCIRSDGLYCVIKIELSAPPDNALLHTIKEYSKQRIHYNRSRLERGICVSSRCNNNENDNLDIMSIEKCVNETIYNEYQLEATVSIYYCNNSKGNHYELGDWIFGIILTSIVLLNIFATIYDVYLQKNEQKGNQYLLSFSLVRNWGHLVSSQIDPNFERFACIDGIRTFLSFVTVLSHTIFIFSSGFIDNVESIEKAYENPLSYILFNGTMVIQTYFIVTGCLFSYTLSLHPEWQNSFIGPMVYRWCRLAPGLAILLGFLTTWYRHLGSGPLWNFYVSPFVNDCRQYWWSHILFFNNYTMDACNIQTWYLAADFQIFAIALILFLVTRNRGRIFGIVLLFIVGCAGPALCDWLQDVNGVFIIYPESFRNLKDESFSLVNVSFISNLSGFSMGLLLGLLTFNAHKYESHFSNHKRILSVLPWLLLPVTLLIFMSGYFLYQNGERPSLPVRIAYSALHRPLLGAIMSIQIIIALFKVEDKFRPTLEWPGWRVPSRLTYGVFLVHISIIHYIQGTKTQLHNASLFNLLIMHLGVVWLSYLIAVPMYLLVEKPMWTVTKRYLHAFNRSTVKKKE